MTFREKLDSSITARDSLLCVGLDPDPERLPAHLRGQDDPILSFNRQLVDATAEAAAAYKPNFAFYGAMGSRGWDALTQTLEYIPTDIPIILDAKVGDIGNTAARYAAMYFDALGADALTVNPLMGGDAVEPFAARTDRGLFLLCLTSNPGAADFIKQPCGDRPLYEAIAVQARTWNTAGNLGLVVGATQAQAIGRLRALAPDMPFLIPGVGAQGGDLQAAVEQAQDSHARGLLINASRSILYASGGRDFAAAAGREARRLRDAINQHRG